MPTTIAPPEGPELVIGVIRPVGTSDEKFRAALSSALLPYMYTVVHIKLSDLLRDEAAQRGDVIPEDDEEARINALMDEGDNLCERYGTGSAVALLGVADIRRHRWEANAASGVSDAEAAETPVPRIAYVLDSLKRPAEVTHLRRIYGDHFLAVSLQAGLATREKALDAKVHQQRPTLKLAERKERIATLVARDLKETDEFGQNILRTFPMADVFLDLERDVTAQASQVVDLLFDSPESRPPTEAEFSMMLADVASTRSPELGLKVGAALMNATGKVVGLGHNAHPNADEVPQFDLSTTDIVELVADTISRLPESVLTPGARAEFAQDPDAFATTLLAGPLEKSRLRDLTEFQRPVHAEMNALLAALQTQAQTAGGTMYVTAYPCHHCARHLIALGLDVTYLEPYPKSRAESMYGAAVGEHFHAFTGVAPRRFPQLFAVTGDRKDAKGVRRPWHDEERAAAVPKIDPFVDAPGIADREATALAVLAVELGTPPAEADENLSHPPVMVNTAGPGRAGSRKAVTRPKQPVPSSPTAPAPRKRPKGGRS